MWSILWTPNIALTFGDNLLLTGCANGNSIQWDIEMSQVDKV